MPLTNNGILSIIYVLIYKQISINDKTFDINCFFFFIVSWFFFTSAMLEVSDGFFFLNGG